MSSLLRVVSVVFVFVFACLTPAVSSNALAASGADDHATHELDEYVVSGTRLPSVREDVLSVPANVTVMTKKDFEKSGARSVQEAIQSAAGVVMYDTVGNAFQQTVDLRGFNGQPTTGTSVFVDGVRVNEPDFNAVNFDLIPLETVERIEIYPNASAMFGKNALGGAINIITRRGTQKRQMTAETLLGSFQRERYIVNASGPAGPIDYFFNVGREIENGYRDASDARLSRFSGKIGFRPEEETDVAVSYAYVENRLLQAGQLSLAELFANRKQNPTPGDFFEHENHLVILNVRRVLPRGFLVSGNAFFRRLNQETFLNFGEGCSSAITMDTESKGGILQLTHRSAPFGRQNVFVLGGEVTRNDFNGASSSSRSDANEDIVAWYVHNAFTMIPGLVVTGGLRYDHNQIQFDETLHPTRPDGAVRFNRITPRIGLSYRVAPSTSVYVNYTRGFRAPTATEIFALPPFSSNPDLQPSQADNYEVGVKSKSALWGEFAFALFHSMVGDEIVFTCVVCDGTFGDGINRNAQSVRRRGVELTLKRKIGKYFDGEINYAFTEARFLNREVFSSTQIIDPGDSLPLVPKNRFSVIGAVHPRERLTITLTGSYVSTQFALGDEANEFPRLPGYVVLHGRASYDTPVAGGFVKVFLSANNLLDSAYSTYGNASSFGRTFVPAPGIAVFGGIRYQFYAS